METKTRENHAVDIVESDPLVFSKMAPKKVKTQGKRNKIKIKSKVNTPKRGKCKKEEKPLDNLKWLNKMPPDISLKKTVPEWLNSGAYKHKMAVNNSETNTSQFEEYPPPDAEEKSSASDASDECNCSNSKLTDDNKGGILKRKTSSSNSLVANYIKSGMDQVASFIVESAIRFGEQHGVVVQDKDSPDVYEITSPDKKMDQKYRKIRFKMPDKCADYESTKKIWRGHNKISENSGKRAQTPMPQWKAARVEKSSSWESTPDSLEEILPILEKLKEGDVVNSDLDLDKLADPSDSEDQVRERERNRDRERDRDRDRGRERDRERERERERERSRERERDRLRDKYRTRRKRYKSLGGRPDEDLEGSDYPDETRWKKFRHDSVELGRRRIKPTTSPRQQESVSSYSY